MLLHSPSAGVGIVVGIVVGIAVGVIVVRDCIATVANFGKPTVALAVIKGVIALPVGLAA